MYLVILEDIQRYEKIRTDDDNIASDYETDNETLLVGANYYDSDVDEDSNNILTKEIAHAEIQTL